MRALEFFPDLSVSSMLPIAAAAPIPPHMSTPAPAALSDEQHCSEWAVWEAFFILIVDVPKFKSIISFTRMECWMTFLTNPTAL